MFTLMVAGVPDERLTEDGALHVPERMLIA
jgi:hypothetical protein